MPHIDNNNWPDASETSQQEQRSYRKGHIRFLGMSLGFVALLVYLIVSIFVPAMWGKLWVVFLLVPPLESIADVILQKSIKAFDFACFVVFIYLFVGMFFGVWHPTWIMFFSIPVWSIVIGKKKIFEIRND